jgi:hypothetical protein
VHGRIGELTPQAFKLAHQLTELVKHGASGLSIVGPPVGGRQ